MSRTFLSSTSEWELADGTPDIRGFTAFDASGAVVGTVRGLLADTDAEIVSTIVLDTGDEIPAFDVTIGDGEVYLAGAIPGAAIPGELPAATHVPVARRVVPVPVAVPVPVPETHAFRAHHAQAAEAVEFEGLDAAYRYGYAAAYADGFRNRAFVDAEPALRAGYPTERDYDRDRDAIRFGYHHAQQGE